MGARLLQAEAWACCHSLRGCGTWTSACVSSPQGYNLVRTHEGDGAFVIVDHDEKDDFQVRKAHLVSDFRVQACARGTSTPLFSSSVRHLTPRTNV